MASSLNGTNTQCLKLAGRKDCLMVQLASFNMKEVNQTGETPPTNTMPLFEKNTLIIMPGALQD